MQLCGTSGDGSGSITGSLSSPVGVLGSQALMAPSGLLLGSTVPGAQGPPGPAGPPGPVGGPGRAGPSGGSVGDVDGGSP